MPAKCNHNINTATRFVFLTSIFTGIWLVFPNSHKDDTDLWSWICFYGASTSVVLVLVPHLSCHCCIWLGKHINIYAYGEVGE